MEALKIRIDDLMKSHWRDARKLIEKNEGLSFFIAEVKRSYGKDCPYDLMTINIAIKEYVKSKRGT